MTNIYLIRHVQAEGNLFRVMQGDWDGVPTALGLRQAELLGARFQDTPLDAIYSSDLSRAVLTAEALRRGHALELRLDARLREINVGPWEGRFFGDLLHEEPERIRQYLLREDGWKQPGAEDYAEVTARAWPALEEILRDNEGKTVAVVSHGVTIRCLLARMLRLGRGDPERLPIGGNTAVSLLRYDGEAFTPVFLGDCSHLEPLRLPAWEDAPSLWAESIDPRREADFYAACYADAWRCSHGSLRGFDAGAYLASAAAHHDADPRAVLRLWAEDKCAGLLDLDTRRGENAGYGWLSLAYLKPEYRGRGIGIQLLGRAFMHYRALSRRSLRLTVAEDNAAALAFYRRWGFTPLGAENGAAGRMLLMENSIGGPGYV